MRKANPTVKTKCVRCSKFFGSVNGHFKMCPECRKFMREYKKAAKEREDATHKPDTNKKQRIPCMCCQKKFASWCVKKNRMCRDCRVRRTHAFDETGGSTGRHVLPRGRP